MFNRALQVRVVKAPTTGDNSTTPVVPALTTDEINKILSKQVRTAGYVVGTVSVYVIAANTISKIAIIRAQAEADKKRT